MVLFGGHQGRKAAGWINPKENEHGEPLVNHNISYRKYTSSFMVDVPAGHVNFQVGIPFLP